MTYTEAEQIRRMIDDHWKLRMGDEVSDLWLGSLLDKEADIAMNAVARLAKTLHHPPKISDLEEVYAMLVDNASLPPAESCPTCSGDLFVLVSMRKPTRTQWMEDQGIDVPASGSMMEEYAPCPDCNPDCNTSFPRHNGTVFHGPDTGLVRERMAPAVHHPVPRGEQKLPGDVKDYLQDMRGVSAEFDLTDPGPCDDCKRQGPRVEYGMFSLCERCASRRKKVAEELASADVVKLLQEVK